MSQSERKLPVSGQQKLGEWGRGGSKGRAFSLKAKLPPPPLPSIQLCQSHPLGKPPSPLPHTPSPNPHSLFGGWGVGRNYSLQFSTKSMNSRHLILHPSNLGLGPLHVLAKFKITAPEKSKENAIMDVQWGRGVVEEGMRDRMKLRHRDKNGGSNTHETPHQQE